MQVNADRLEARLADRGLEELYFFYGDEPLQLLECADAVRRQAMSEQVTERAVFDIDVGFDWQALMDGSREMSLFASRRLIEIRLGNRKPDKKGTDVLDQLVESGQTEDVLLITALGADSKARKTKWFKTLEQHAVSVMTRALKQNTLRGWLNRRAQHFDKRLTTEAAEMIADRVEGNMLAAVQEVEKLCLLVDVNEIGASEVMNAVSDSARYDVFQLVDAVVAGDSVRAVRISRGLQEEGIEPVLVNWALGRELRNLVQMAAARGSGKSQAAVLEQFRVWKSRRSSVTRAMERLGMSELTALLAYSNSIDTVVKGAREGNPWDALELLIINSSGTMNFSQLLNTD